MSQIALLSKVGDNDMTGNSHRTDRRIGRPLLLSLLGIALISPVPLLAADPALTPAWLLNRVDGVPVLSLAMLGLMAGMVGVAMLSLPKIKGQDA